MNTMPLSTTVHTNILQQCNCATKEALWYKTNTCTHTHTHTGKFCLEQWRLWGCQGCSQDSPEAQHCCYCGWDCRLYHGCYWWGGVWHGTAQQVLWLQCLLSNVMHWASKHLWQPLTRLSFYTATNYSLQDSVIFCISNFEYTARLYLTCHLYLSHKIFHTVQTPWH